MGAKQCHATRIWHPHTVAFPLECPPASRLSLRCGPFLGAKLVLLVCLLVWSADSGAYFAGKRFGKRKMAPSVSPNKTIEGLIGGIAAAIVVTLGAAEYLAIPFSSLPVLAVIALVTAFASVLGDLAESMFKRVAGVKDSGSILPGHGVFSTGLIA